MLLRDIQVPADWASLASRLVDGSGPVMILGAVDTGKSTLARYLLGRLIERGGPAALLDGDVGQALVGTPGLIGLTLVVNVDSLTERTAVDRSWFVGSTSPVGQVVSMLLGHASLVRLSQQAGMPLVVNTSGWVQGLEAKQMHLGVADLVVPGLVVGLQQESEIEHLLRPLERRGIDVVRLKPSPRVRPKPEVFREQIRTERFAAYFAEAERRELALDAFSLEQTLLGSGRPLDEGERKQLETGLDAYLVEAEEAGDGCALVLASQPLDEAAARVAADIGRTGIHAVESHDTAGLLVGLLAADGECLGLGLIDSWSGDGSIAIYTPLDDDAMRGVRRLSFGSLRLTRTGDEHGTWRGDRRLDLDSESVEHDG